jgi:hypothetical protein
MKTTSGSFVLLLFGLAACAGRSEESAEETTRVATDTLVEKRQVVDTMLVQTETKVKADTNIAADTNIVADTTIAADTNVTADTTMASDTTRTGDEGVISVDTTRAQ